MYREREREREIPYIVTKNPRLQKPLKYLYGCVCSAALSSHEEVHIVLYIHICISARLHRNKSMDEVQV
ncbi:hypothetical protein ACOSQ4_030891 [Xanthoceras sorbifolium]